LISYELSKSGVFTVANEWSDAGYGNTYNWGGPVEGIGVGASETYTVHGRLIAGGSTNPGTYTDVVQVTVHY
jgi:spore coat protein U-like protein